MNELTTQSRQLPDTLEDLARFVLIGREKLTAVRAEIRAIKKVELAKEVHEQKLEEGQEIAEAVLDAEVKIGELTREMDKSKGGRPAKTTDTDVHSLAIKAKQLSEIGISEKQKQRYENLAAHPKEVEAAKKEAREQNRIVTRQDALKRIPTPRRAVEPEFENRRQREARELREAEKRSAEYDQKRMVDIQEVIQNKDDVRKMYEAMQEDFRTMVRSIRHMAYKIEDGKLRKVLAAATDEELEALFEQVSHGIETLFKIQGIITEEMNEK